MNEELCRTCGTVRLASFRYCRICQYDFESGLHPGNPPIQLVEPASRKQKRLGASMVALVWLITLAFVLWIAAAIDQNARQQSAGAGLPVSRATPALTASSSLSAAASFLPRSDPTPAIRSSMPSSSPISTTPGPKPSRSPVPHAARLALLSPCPHTPRCYEYVVRRGDNIWSIAQWFGVSLSVVREMNPSLQHRNLAPGLTIRLPPPTR
jgi:hypothetical protein